MLLFQAGERGFAQHRFEESRGVLLVKEEESSFPDGGTTRAWISDGSSIGGAGRASPLWLGTLSR